MAGSVTVQGLLTGTTSGTQYIGPYTLVPNVNGNFEVLEPTLASGANTIAIPSWATTCVINPPNTNGVTLALKGVSGDTGIAIAPAAPTVLSFNPAGPPASFVITAASTLSLPTSIVFT